MRQRAFFVAALVTACGIAACSSGATVTPPTNTGGGGSAANNIITATLGASTASASFTTQNGLPGTLTVPSGSGTATFAFTTAPASGFVVIQTAGKRPATAIVSNTSLFYLTITAGSTAVTLNTLPGESVGVTTAPTNPIYEAQGTLNGTYSYWQTVAGPFADSGTTVTVPAAGGPITIAAGTSLDLAIYQGSSISPSPQPIAAGNTYAFAGTLAQNIVYSYPTANPTGVPTSVPSGMPPLNATATVSSTVTVQAAPTPFFAAPGVSDFHSVETDAYPLQSNVFTTDAWYASTASAFQLFGSSVGDGVCDTFTTQYAAPLTIDQLPEVGGTWTNSPASTIVETDADGTHSTRTYAANGTYSETQTVPGARTAIITVAADGSGTYEGTAFSTFYGIKGFSFSAPSSRVITVSIVPTSGSPFAVANPVQWYTLPFTPYAETDTMTLNKPIDAKCALSPQFGATGNDVTQTISRVDPVLGYTETRSTDTYYVTGIGSVCVVLSDNQNYYYNYNNDDGTIGGVSNVFGDGTVQSVQTTSEAVSLQTTNGIQPTLSGAKVQNAAANGALSPSAIAFTQAQFDARLSIFRRVHENAMRSYFVRVSKNLEAAK